MCRKQTVSVNLLLEYLSTFESVRVFKVLYFSIRLNISEQREKPNYIVRELRTFVFTNRVSTNVLILSWVFLVHERTGRN